MYECLYGSTPFACEDRYNTKLKILKHKQTLKFPHVDPSHQVSVEALDLMMQLLVEKEGRICTRRYELNDFTQRTVGGKRLRFAADKTHKNWEGRFVYSDDAEDIKHHPWFRNVRWGSMPERNPPFVPRVKSWEDTKYFDDEQMISDIDSASSDEDDAEHIYDAETVVVLPGMDGKLPGASSSDDAKVRSRASQHHHEDQHIIPSTAIKLKGGNGDFTTLTPLLAEYPPTLDGGKTVQWKEEKLEGGSAHSHPDSVITRPKKKKERKRPRDKILRDPIAGPTAMKIRKEGAFIRYAYRKPKAVDEVIKEVLENDQAATRDSEGMAASRHFSPDYRHEKRVYLEHGGKMVHAGH